MGVEVELRLYQSVYQEEEHERLRELHNNCAGSHDLLANYRPIW